MTFLSPGWGPLVGGHFTFERVTFSPSQKGHQQNHLVVMILLVLVVDRSQESPLKIGHPKRETGIPTIYFQVFLLLVSGRVVIVIPRQGNDTSPVWISMDDSGIPLDPTFPMTDPWDWYVYLRLL